MLEDHAMCRHWSATSCIAVLLMLCMAERLRAAPEIMLTEMTRHAVHFLQMIEPQNVALVQLDFGDYERKNWTYVPAGRKGMALKSLNTGQRQAAIRLLKSGLSESGYEKAHNIMLLESVLREIEGSSFRDPELYYITIFGEPSASTTWGWRFEGHHLSLNYTIVEGKTLATAPQFWGANPARVLDGQHEGLQVLAKEEDFARRLVQSLTDRQRSQAVTGEDAPPEILTTDMRRVDPLEEEGVGFDQLQQEQRKMLLELIEVYLHNLPDKLSRMRRESIELSDLSTLHFSWRGKIEEGERHYYRIQGATFLIEYDNYQNQANHVHTVWRDFNGDFGRDLLGEHLAGHKH